MSKRVSDKEDHTTKIKSWCEVRIIHSVKLFAHVYVNTILIRVILLKRVKHLSCFLSYTMSHFFYLCHVISSPELIIHVGWIIKNIYIANRKNTYAICSQAEISIWCKMSSVRVNRNRMTTHLK